jgi:hypothetical protein
MDDHTSTPSSAQKVHYCADPKMLCDLHEGGKDKLGHKIEQLLWVANSYAIYRTKEGVYVHFSDDEEEAKEQRQRFTKVCPELCELRYLTPQIASAEPLIFRRKNYDGSSLYDHNVAQAIMLVMERDVETGRKIAQQALKMAVDRVANDNTVRYICVSAIAWASIVVLVAVTGVALHFVWHDPDKPWCYLVAGMGGATGAMLSIATRVQSFRLKPCNQSNMNYCMSVIRVGTGVVAGLLLLLLAPIILSDVVKNLFVNGSEAEMAVVLGFVGGFAERLIPNIMRWTGQQLEPSFGTPSQAVRAEEMQTSKQVEPRTNIETQDVKAKRKRKASHEMNELGAAGVVDLHPTAVRPER